MSTFGPHQARVRPRFRCHPFGGLGRAYELFGEQLAAILEELNARLAA